VNSSKIAINKLILYERKGNFYNLRYLIREVVLPEITPKPNQKTAIDQITEEYKNSEHKTTAILWGSSNSGKSMIG
jgi:hypothetical protein